MTLISYAPSNYKCIIHLVSLFITRNYSLLQIKVTIIIQLSYIYNKQNLKSIKYIPLQRKVHIIYKQLSPSSITHKTFQILCIQLKYQSKHVVLIHQYIEDICLFQWNIDFISRVNSKNWYVHEWRVSVWCQQLFCIKFIFFLITQSLIKFKIVWISWSRGILAALLPTAEAKENNHDIYFRQK